MRGERELLEPSRYQIGIAHVIIPGESVSRDEFINQILQTERIPIVTEDNSFVPDALILKNVISDLEFPREVGGIGGPVVYINHPIFDRPIIVGSISPVGRSTFSKEGSKTIGKSDTFGNATITVDPITGSVILNASNGTETKEWVDKSSVGNLNINVSNSEEKGKVRLAIKGDINLFIESKDSKSGNYKRYSKNVEVSADEKYTLSGKNVDISSKEKTTIDSEKLIEIGRENLEPCVKGDANATMLSGICDNLKTTVEKLEKVVTALVVYSTAQDIASTPSPLTPLNAGYKKLKIDVQPLPQEISSIKSSITELKGKIDKTKSTLAKVE